MRMGSAERWTEPVGRSLPFRTGDRLDQPTFHALYERCPHGVKAELIGGIVYIMPSPVSPNHGRPHLRLAHWLNSYVDETPGTDGFDNTTNILSDESEPQPDLCLIVRPDFGGQTSVNEKGYMTGGPELVAEVAYSSVNIDLHAKRADYEAAGVREYFVALTEIERVVRFVLRRGRLVEKAAGADGVIRSAVFPGLWLNASALYAPNTRAMMTTLRAGLATPEHAAFVAKLEAKRAALARRKPKS